MNGLGALTLGWILLTLSATAFWFLSRRGSRESPHEDIPSRREIPRLMAEIVARPEVRELLAKRHHRGAIYWYAIDQGFEASKALELALSPEASAVKYEIING